MKNQEESVSQLQLQVFRRLNKKIKVKGRCKPSFFLVCTTSRCGGSIKSLCDLQKRARGLSFESKLKASTMEPPLPSLSDSIIPSSPRGTVTEAPPVADKAK
jgi:hypothetical protein